MAVARMAQDREGADEILALQPAGIDQRAETGGHGEAALAHRARLRGTEAGAWTGALRRTELARLSPPCQLLHCCLRLPGGGTMLFSPTPDSPPLRAANLQLRLPRLPHGAKPRGAAD